MNALNEDEKGQEKEQTSRSSLPSRSDVEAREIERLRQQLNFDKQEIQRLTQLVEDQKSPYKWNLRQLIHAFRLRILPLNTKRERFARNIYRSLRGLPPVKEPSPAAMISELSQDSLERSFQEMSGYLSDFRKPPLVSIIIPAYNCLDYTRQCVESILHAEQELLINLKY